MGAIIDPASLPGVPEVAEDGRLIIAPTGLPGVLEVAGMGRRGRRPLRQYTGSARSEGRCQIRSPVRAGFTGDTGGCRGR